MQTVSENAIIREMDADQLVIKATTLHQIKSTGNLSPEEDKALDLCYSNYWMITGETLTIY
jgi:hypothetical protein